MLLPDLIGYRDPDTNGETTHLTAEWFEFVGRGLLEVAANMRNSES